MAGMGKHDDDDYDWALDWARKIQPNTIARWYTVGVVLADVHTGFIDVSVEGPDPLRPVWTVYRVDDPDEDESMDPTTFPLPFDRDHWTVRDDKDWDLEQGAVAVDPGVALTRAEVEALEAVVAEHPDRRQVQRSDGWSSATINTALSKWCDVHAGRSDIVFEFDDINPRSP